MGKKSRNKKIKAQTKIYQSAHQAFTNLTLKYPTLLDHIKSARVNTAMHRAWDKSCYIPSGTVETLIDKLEARNIITFNHEQYLTEKLTAFSAWNYLKGVYQIEQSVADILIDSEINGILPPAEQLQRLPEYCPYIATDSRKLNQLAGTTLKGFFANIDHNIDDGVTLLTFLLDTGKEQLPYHVMLGDWGLTTGIKKAYLYKSQFDNFTDLDSVEVNDTILQLMTALVSMTLFLCEEEPDIEHLGDEPIESQSRATRASKPKKLSPPRKPKLFIVGKKMGSEIKKCFTKYTSSKMGKSKKPHPRRPHWRLQWFGKKGTPERKQKAIWISMMFINTKFA